jgi:IS5 family transposase
LLNITRETLRYAEAAVPLLRQERGIFAALAQRLASELEHYIPLVWMVVSQTERRVLHGESVPAEEKLVSLFEPHTDIIRKDGRDTYYGHKVTFTGGKSGLLLDWVVEDGNPADSTLFVRMLDRQRDLRAGIEGMISCLKRVFGPSRCTWKGAESCASYVGASVVSANLLLLARHLMI